jgi:hypothetical protein
MKKIYKQDIGWGIFFLAFSIFIWIIVPFEISDSKHFALGPRFFPRVISLILGLVSLGFVISTYFKHKKEMGRNSAAAKENVKAEAGKRISFDELRAVLVFACMLIYALLMPIIGFVISSILTAGIILFILGGRKWYYYGIVALSVLLIFYVFKYLLYVQLP